jgi:hypothetical protein
MGYSYVESSLSTSNNYSGNIVVPINFQTPTTFQVVFRRTTGFHTGSFEYYENGQLRAAGGSPPTVGEFLVRNINIDSWSGISSIQFRSTINDSNLFSTTPSEWKVFVNSVLVYYHAFDR